MGLFDTFFGSQHEPKSGQQPAALGGLDPMTVALLSAGAAGLEAGGPSTRPVSNGQAIARMFTSGLQGYNSVLDRQAEKELRDLKMKHLGLGMEKDALELQQARDAMDRQKRIRERTVGLFNPGLTPAAGGELQAPLSMASASPGGAMSPKVGGPDWLQSYQAQQPQHLGQPSTQTKPQRNMTRAFTDQLIAKANIYAEEGDDATALKMYEQATKFMPKVKDWKQVNIGGKVMYAPYFEDGTPGEPVPYEVVEKLHFANTGGFTVGQNPFTGQVVSRIQNTRSPDSLASEATQRWVHGTPSATAVLNAQQGKIPPGYRVSTDGSRLEAIPGGPADIGKALPSPAVKDLAGAGTSVENTRRLAGSFKDEFGGKVVLGDMSNTMGRIFGDDTGQAQWWQDQDQQQNQTRHELFGSALTKTELAAWEKTAVTPNMDPKQIRENLQRRSEIEARAASKLARAYEAGGYNKQQIRELLGSAAEYLEAPAPPVAPVGGKAPAAGSQPNTSRNLLPNLPTPNATNRGKLAIDHQTGKRYRSNGMQWTEEQ